MTALDLREIAERIQVARAVVDCLAPHGEFHGQARTLMERAGEQTPTARRSLGTEPDEFLRSLRLADADLLAMGWVVESSFADEGGDIHVRRVTS